MNQALEIELKNLKDLESANEFLDSAAKDTQAPEIPHFGAKNRFQGTQGDIFLPLNLTFHKNHACEI